LGEQGAENKENTLIYTHYLLYNRHRPALPDCTAGTFKTLYRVALILSNLPDIGKEISKQLNKDLMPV